MQRFAAAQAKWEARPFADYSFETRTSCFCPPEINRWTRVSVRSGVVVSAEAVDPDPNYPITGSYWQPIDAVFADLHGRMTEQDSYLAEIAVEYDSQLGYPRSIHYRAKPNIADGGAVIEIRNVVPLN
jgi:uncharacterized protein DUF6174